MKTGESNLMEALLAGSSHCDDRSSRRADPTRKYGARWDPRAPRLYLCVSAVMFLFGLSIGHAQSYSIDWYKIAGGGGTSTGGVYAVSGTIGQHDAGGPMTGGSYSLTGGFWALISVVQTAGAPTLFISHSGNAVTVYWQNVSGWSLQQNNDLSLPANWLVNHSWTTANGTNSLTLTASNGDLFFRLKNP